jgi:hypothetical protein
VNVTPINIEQSSLGGYYSIYFIYCGVPILNEIVFRCGRKDFPLDLSQQANSLTGALLAAQQGIYPVVFAVRACVGGRRVPISKSFSLGMEDASGLLRGSSIPDCTFHGMRKKE